MINKANDCNGIIFIIHLKMCRRTRMFSSHFVEIKCSTVNNSHTCSFIRSFARLSFILYHLLNWIWPLCVPFFPLLHLLSIVQANGNDNGHVVILDNSVKMNHKRKSNGRHADRAEANVTRKKV